MLHYKSWHSGSLPDGGRAYGSPAKALAKQLDVTAWTSTR
jgi:hypothetical protein